MKRTISWMVAAALAAGAVGCSNGSGDAPAEAAIEAGALAPEAGSIPVAAPEAGAVPQDASPGVTVVQVAAGGFQACAVKSDGTVACWGNDTWGDLGDGRDAGGDLVGSGPVLVSGITDAVQVASGYATSCAVRRSGNVVCWGTNAVDALGSGYETATEPQANTPMLVAGLTDAVEVKMAFYYVCARRTTGAVACWGSSLTPDAGPSALPLEVPGLTDAVEITVGMRHACARRQTGEVVCWGGNDYNQLGPAAVDAGAGLDVQPVTIEGLTNVATVSAGDLHTCALLKDGSVWCWGLDLLGLSDAGSFASAPTPTRVAGITGAVQIAGGMYSACAILASGQVTCWGADAYGALGDGKPTGSAMSFSPPVGVVGLQARSLSSSPGFLHTCAVTAAGGVACWGLNEGVVGQPFVGQVAGPIPVKGVSHAMSVAVGGTFTCAVTAPGSVSCWGANDNGVLGNGATPGSAPTSSAVPVVGIVDAVNVVAGDGYACALHQTGTVSCWGSNTYGQLGNGNSNGEPTSTPTPVLILNNIVEIAGGLDATCARRTDGTVACWGYGFGTSPVTIVGVTQATQITGGISFCALHATGDVVSWTWGGGWVTPVPGLTSAVQIASGGSQICARLGSGDVLCWGQESSGELGNGLESGSSATPAAVIGLHDAVDISAGWGLTCARHQNGTAVCWGTSSLVGYPSTKDVLVPGQPVQNLAAATQIAIASDHVCAVLSDGTVACWGQNGMGGLGDGSLIESSTPLSITGL